MPQDTPEAILIPRHNPLERFRPLPPQNIVGASGAALKIYDEALEQACEDIVLQNQSTTAVKVSWNQPCSEASFHEILAAAVATEDGTGGNTTLQVKKYGMMNVSLFCGATAINVTVSKFQRQMVLGFI